MIDRFLRAARSWLFAIGNRIPIVGERDSFKLGSSDAIRDPEVRAQLDKWKQGEISTEEFRKWLDDKWEREQG
ncbi:MAG: hypothetical protein R3178_07330 [Rhodothermales bacterium]|nr:hypothetical protein [Rhodothermales bacterium]